MLFVDQKNSKRQSDQQIFRHSYLPVLLIPKTHFEEIVPPDLTQFCRKIEGNNYIHIRSKGRFIKQVG